MSEHAAPPTGAILSADIAVPEHEREVRFYSRVLSTGGDPAHLPPVWMIYLPVGDLAQSLHHVQEEGGEVIKAIQGEDGQHVYAVVRDPVGAHLAWVTTERKDSTP